MHVRESVDIVLILCCRVTATLCFLVLTHQEAICTGGAIITALTNLPAIEEKMEVLIMARAEIVLQLVRLAVNARLLPACSDAVVHCWQTDVDLERRAAFARRLNGPMRRRIPSEHS